MFFDSSENLAQTQTVMRPQDFVQATNVYTPTGLESAGASMSTAFDRTMGVRLYEEIQLHNAEQAALEAGTTFRYHTEEDYKRSEDYVPGMKFYPGMTQTRARMLRENYDLRRQRELLLSNASHNGMWLHSVTNFGAGMVGSLPDPINIATMLIPIGGPAITGGRLAGMTGKQILMQSLKPSIIGTAAASNLISSGYAAWDLNAKGENITMGDVLLDTLMGAVLAPVFHTGGTLFSRARVRRGIRSSFDDLRSAFPDSPELVKVVERLKRSDPEAYRTYGQHLERLTDNTGRALDAADYVRNKITPGERLELARWMAFALNEVAAGRPVDMAQIVQGSPVLKKIESLVNEYRATQQEAPTVIDSVQAAKSTLAGLEKSLSKAEKDFGVAVPFALGERHGLGESLKNIRSLTDSVRTTLRELTDLQDARVVTLDTIRKAQADMKKAQAEYKAYADAMILPESLRKHLGAEPLARLEATIAEAQAKLADLETQISEKLGDTAPASVDKLDYRTSSDRTPDTLAETEPLLSGEGKTQVQELVESGIDPKTGISDVEASLKNLTPEEKAMLDAHSKEGEFINRKERVALEESRFVECIMGAGALA